MKDLHRAHLELAAAAIDFELAPRERESLRRHLSTCTSCRARVTGLGVDARQISNLPLIELPAERAARVWRALDRRHRPAANLRLVLVAALLALAALVAVSAGAELVRRQLDDDLAVVPNPSPVPTSVVDSTAPPDGSPQPDASWAPMSEDPILQPAPAAGERHARAMAATTATGQMIVAVGCLAEPQEIGEALCRTPVAWRSADGVTWSSPAPLPDVDDGVTAAWADMVIAYGGTIIAGGSVNDDGAWSPRVWWTTDGADWSSAELPHPGRDVGLDALDVGADGQRIIAVGSAPNGGGAAWYSDDGLDWSIAPFETDPASATFRGAVALHGEEGGFWAWDLGDGGGTTLWGSFDGTSWVEANPWPELEGAGVMQMRRTSDGILAYGMRLTSQGYEQAFWSWDWVREGWTEARRWQESGVTDLVALPVLGGTVAAAYDSLAEQASIWVQPPGEDWRPSSSLGAIEPVALVADPVAPERLFLLALDPDGGIVVWTGAVTWTP